MRIVSKHQSIPDTAEKKSCLRPIPMSSNLNIQMKKIILRITYVLFFTLSGMTNIYAQHEATVTGSVKTKAGKPIDYTSVSLLKAADSLLFRGTISNDTGSYTFDHVPDGSYLLKASAVGYAAAFSPVFKITAGADRQTIARLELLPVSSQLHEVTVTAGKPLIEHASDRTIVNVANSILAAGNSALDILQRAPGVSVDKDDNISLKGKQGVNVMIDDKPTYLSAAQLAALLRSTDGTTIQSIELISNPSAKYDAAGNSGIINIRLKKNRKSGTNGTVVLGAGYGHYYKDNESISMNHQEGKINVFGSFNRHDDQTAQNIDINKIITSGTTGNTYFKQHTFISGTGYNNSYRGGLDYNMTPKNTIGFLISGYFNTEADKNNDLNYIGNQPGTTDSFQNTLSDINQHYHNFAVNLNDKLAIDTSGQQLSFDADYSRFNNRALMQHDTYFYNPDGSVMMPPAFLRTQTPSLINIRTVRTDYTLPVNKSLKLEAGAKFSDVSTDNILDARKQLNGQYVDDTLLTNHFKYDERISAGYINLNKSYKSLTVQAGIRAEYTSSTGTLFNAGQNSVRRNYLDFFPSVFINRVLNDKNEIGISYSRRIDRPGYDNLNPFIYYVDQYTYQVGNPFLKPQYTNKVELNYTYNKAINLSFGFSHTSDVITELFVTKGDTSIDETLNLNSQNYYDIDINAPYTVTKWWSGNADITGFYTKVKSDTLLGGHLNNGKAAFQFKTTQTFLFAKGFKAELITNYSSPQIMGIYTMKPYYGLDAGVSRSFAANKINLKLAVNDIFNTYSMIATANYQTDNIYFKQKGETRVGRLTFTYNFGSSQLKARQHNSGAADENGRVKGGN
jgi:iron complex outermembrane receptor protein